ncbi:3-methyl-2-oxobutanoate hydroxymethyltransferase [Ectothiorhodospiraceae bacterium WFHF3C12]|nr:3-methyl-2-oxobutanoate hydroxymethyltransferase [Ectothiorhodospiraceae bacterium WFHF3C12]
MYAGIKPHDDKPVTVSRLHRMKSEGEAIACLTAYDYTFSAVADAAGVDVVLIGDSLGMVMQGRDTTIPVTVDDIVYHTRCVTAGRRRALVMADMPFMSYTNADEAMRNAGRLMKEGGAHMVKLEGAGDQASLVRALSSAGVPVCAHLGLQPQLVHKIGGYRVQGKDTAGASQMLQDAQKLQEAGADMLLVECIPASLGGALASRLDIPVIGIGAGPSCDGQILVLQDMLGITPGKTPKFSKDFMGEAESVPAAVQAYVRAVKRGQFPAEEHCF